MPGMEPSDLIRSVTERLRRYVGERRKSLRRGPRFEARLPFTITLIGNAKGSGKRRMSAAAIVGHTRDLSGTSMTLLLPSVRVGNAYLTDGEICLEVKLELPDGQVTMLTNCVRFEQLARKEDGCSYLLAVCIVEMETDERARYLSFLESIGKKGRRTRERRQAAASASTNTKSTAQAGTWESLTPASIDNAFEQFLEE